ncbi:MAG TPA: acyl-CoA thioesterase [Nitrospirota bacterium]|nr:acyl-CoA thioesterase [Nitrospirota bacterium]
MEGKCVSNSSVIMAQMMIPQDANPAGNVHGGVVVKIIDEAAGVVAARHTRMNVVTASIDRMDFHHPIFVGDLLFFKASLNFVGKTSMEIGVRVEAENLKTGEVRHAASAYLTYVAIDHQGKPVPVPPLILETEEERRRNNDARSRRSLRLAERNRQAQHKLDSDARSQ